MTLPCEDEFSEKFRHQVMITGLCLLCDAEVRGWFGIDHAGESDETVFPVSRKKFAKWDARIKAEATIQDGGSIVVMAQRRFDGKSGEMTMQRVR